jgi:hypothetical protein
MTNLIETEALADVPKLFAVSSVANVNGYQDVAGRLVCQTGISATRRCGSSGLAGLGPPLSLMILRQRVTSRMIPPTTRERSHNAGAPAYDRHQVDIEGPRDREAMG